MPSLREKFIAEAAKSKAEIIAATNSGLESGARGLKEQIERHINNVIKNNPHRNQITADLNGLTLDDARNLSGYKRYHEACAAPNVDMKIELTLARNSRDEEFPQLVITLDKPYSESPDAALFAPKAQAPTPRTQPNLP